MFSSGRFVAKALMLGVLLVGGCAGKPQLWPAFSGDPDATLTAPLPLPVAGDRLTFDNGQSETVVEVVEDIVTWRNDRGVVHERSRDPLMPSLRWKSKYRNAEVTFGQGAPGSMWPLRADTQARIAYSNFVWDRRTHRSRVYRSEYLCQVRGTMTQTTPAGRFQGYQIDCRKFSRDHRISGYRRFFYAPESGYVISQEDIFTSDRPAKVKRLIGIELSLQDLAPNVRQDLAKARNKALSTLPSGQSLGFSSADKFVLATFTPLRTFKTDKGYYCREYQEARTVGPRKGRFTATACNLPKRGWVRR